MPGTAPSASNRIPSSPGTIRRSCSGPDPRHHPGPQLEGLAVGVQEPRALERDVHLLLVRVLDARVMPMVWVPIPVRRQRHHLHAPAADAQCRTRSPREPVVDRLHLLERCHGHVHHDALLRSVGRPRARPSRVPNFFNPRSRENSSAGAERSIRPASREAVQLRRPPATSSRAAPRKGAQGGARPPARQGA